ncbi:hypothetical protein QJS10_CPB22g00609 [Acorus calamus]|uniref:Uncharacterized protein n=1 Tax=Acorus calamus TaxID=4465 RepID=A0AAV9C192_ACOCL|nr:hypothetical protein QJS10_CPB22g00618 [Acorus calamus]KAK1282492.1 hypothetical protein QJS10_CPB22g00609 [Acorus calamus]
MRRPNRLIIRECGRPMHMLKPPRGMDNSHLNSKAMDSFILWNANPHYKWGWLHQVQWTPDVWH